MRFRHDGSSGSNLFIPHPAKPECNPWVILCLFLICIASSSHTAEHTPVVLIGWDGASWNILDSLLACGKLPALASLMNRGRAGYLESTPNFVSPPAWAAIYSGKNPGKTDIFHFGRREDELPRLGDLSGWDMKARWIWDILSEAGRTCALVNVPLTYPARPLNGMCITGEFSPCVITPPELIVVRDWDELPHGGTGTGSSIVRLHDESVEFTMMVPQRGDPTMTLLRNGKYIAGPGLRLNEWSPWFTISVDGEPGWARITLRSVGRNLARLWLSPVYRTVETIPGTVTYPPEWEDTLRVRYHRFLPFVRWNWKPAIEHTTWFGGLSRDVLTRANWDFYTTVFLAPDHMQHLYGADYRTVAVLEEVDRVTGRIIEAAPEDALIMLVSDHGFAHYDRRIDVNSWLSESGLVRFDENGTALPESSVAWSTMWSIYFNESKLAPAEMEILKTRLISRSSMLRDMSRNGRPVGLTLIPREEAYHGPYTQRAPHLVAVTRETSYVPEFWDRKNIGSDGMRHVFRDTGIHDSWDHAPVGIMVVSGKDIPHSTERFHAAVYDLVPTILSYMGLCVAEDMDGVILRDLFTSGVVLKEDAVRTYERDTILPTREATSPITLEERLRALGYAE